VHQDHAARADPKKEGLAKVGTQAFERERDAVVADLSMWATSVEVDRWTDVPYEDSLTPRQQDTWRPLVALAEAAGGDWPERVGACIEKSADTGDTATQPHDIVPSTYDLCLRLPTLSRMANPIGLSVKTLRDALVNHGGKRWDGSGLYELLDEKELKKLLRRYHVVSTKTTGGYYRFRWADLERMWGRYLARAEGGAHPERMSTTSTTSTQPSAEIEQVNTASVVELPGVTVAEMEAGVPGSGWMRIDEFGGTFVASGCERHRFNRYGWHSGCPACIEVRKASCSAAG
jgi:hypothetical protein